MKMSYLIRLLLRILYRVRVLGDLAPFGQADRLLIVADHHSRLDAIVLALFLPHDPVVIVPPDETVSRLGRWLLSHIRHEILDLNNPLSMKRVLRLLRTGRPVVVFPEGRIVENGAVMKIYPVPALAALKSGASVLPAHVQGAAQWLSRSGSASWLRRWLPAITLRVFSATRIDGGAAGSARQRRAFATRRLAAVMQAMAVQSHPCKPLFECFLDAVSAHGRKTLLMEDQGEKPYSYGDILRMSLALSRLLRRCTTDRENVGVLLPNMVSAVAVVMALSAARRVPAMFNYSAGPLAAQSARVAAGVRTVITSRRFIEQAHLQPLLDVLQGCAVIYIEDLRAQLGFGDKFWLIAFALRMPRLAIAKQSTLDPAVVLFTSGTEDQPKGVVLSHRAIVTNVAQIRAVFDFSPADKVLNPLPLYHAYSFTAGVMLPLITGTRVNLFISPLRYRAIPEIAYKRDCTILFGTSTFLSFYARYANPMDFSRLRHVISGGEKLSAEVARVWMEKFGVRIMEGYGSTECAPVISLATPAAFRHGTVGTLLPAIEHQIEPVEGIEKGGVLHVRGPNLMLGYYRCQNPGVIEAPKSSIGEGWYDTGDVIDIDHEGLLTISGRVKRFAKIAGEMMSLDMIEHVARQASADFHHAAMLTMQESGGETTVLFTTDPWLTRSRLLNAARQLGTHDLSVARRLVLLKELPLLRSGKIDYVALKSLIEGDEVKRLLAAAMTDGAAGSATSRRRAVRIYSRIKTAP
jgi:acyl-[acyl-carrier-protein]-phospholipid O-acyltransferase/long-chain-fatty-acid--[acyl-carrier-protein] ligase